MVEMMKTFWKTTHHGQTHVSLNTQSHMVKIVRWLSNCDCAICKTIYELPIPLHSPFGHEKIPSLVTVYVPPLTSKEPGVVRLRPWPAAGRDNMKYPNECNESKCQICRNTIPVGTPAVNHIRGWLTASQRLSGQTCFPVMLLILIGIKIPHQPPK